MAGYQTTTLKNGLRVVTHKLKERDSISIGIWVGVGGRYEEDRVKGAAHFLEHIVFKGSKKFTCDEIKQKIEGIGGALNAFTSEEQTCFYAKIPANHIEQTFDVLSDMVVFPKISAPDVKKERTVILEEIKMYHDLPQYYVMELLDQLLWPDHPLGKGIIGSHETVGKMSHSELQVFHKMHYAPSNIVVSACGKCDHAKIVRLVQKKLGKINRKATPNFKPSDNNQSVARVKFHKRSIEQMHLALGMIGYDQSSADRYALGLLNIILGGNMSSRLFVRVREQKGLAYSISSSMKAMKDTGIFLVRAGVDNTKITQAVDIIVKELRNVRRDGITQGEFKRAKDYLCGQLLVGLEDTMEHMLWLGESIITKNRVRSLRSVVNNLNKIKRSDIKRVAQEVLDKKRFNLAIVGPLTATQEKDIAKLLKVK